MKTRIARRHMAEQHAVYFYFSFTLSYFMSRLIGAFKASMAVGVFANSKNQKRAYQRMLQLVNFHNGPHEILWFFVLYRAMQ